MISGTRRLNLTTGARRLRGVRQSSAALMGAAVARWASPLVVAGAISALYAIVALVAVHPAVAPGTEGFGYTGDTPLHGLMRWDGAWYAAIAQHGYAGIAGRYQPAAFFPLFPAAVAALHTLLPFVAIPAAGGAINFVATMAGALLIDSALIGWSRRERLLTVAVLLLVPSAFFDVAFYSEALFFFATALVIWAATAPRRLWWGAAAVAFATLDRPVGVLLAVIVLAAAHRFNVGRRHEMQLAIACGTGIVVLLVTYWLSTGSPVAFIAAQDGWTSLRTLGVTDGFRWLAVQLNPFTATNPVVSFGYWELLVVAVPLILLARRRGSPVMYSASGVAVAFVLGGVGTQSRYLAAIVPLWLGAIAALRTRTTHTWTVVMVSAVVVGLCSNLWLVTRFAAGLWAG
ncbi:MAG: mannosyltransferase family protein [Candidatus Dormibacteria bacterium]